MTTRTELQYRIIERAVDIAQDFVLQTERMGGHLSISDPEAVAAIVHVALCEWGAGEGDRTAAQSAHRVMEECLGSHDWLTRALASRGGVTVFEEVKT
jgi:hypothetical protein